MVTHYYSCPEPPDSPPDPYRVICEACGEETTVDDLESLNGGCQFCYNATAPCGDPVALHHWNEVCGACYRELLNES